MYAIQSPLLSSTQTFTKPKLSLSVSLSQSHTRKNGSTRSTICNPQNTLKPQSSDPLWTVAEIAQAVNGRIVKTGPPGTISADTRTLRPSQWFFAISGENFDAHDFITPELARRGCVGVIGNRVCPDWDKGFVEFHGDTIDSLVMMACHARKRFCGELIGVCGSVGKTTTRAMTALALGGLVEEEVYQTCANFNNRIGVALTLIGIPRSARIAVVEMGISHKGEMDELVRMTAPTVRVMVNVAPSHLGNFGSLEEIAMEKGKILSEAKPGDVCVLNADDPLVMSLQVPYGVKKVLFGRRVGCDVRLVDAESINGGYAVRVVLEKDEEMVEFVIPSPGMHLARNACAAAAVVTHLGVPLSQVGTALSTFSPVHMRAELVVAKNGMKIVNDSYNASPLNMKANIELLNGLDCNGKRVAILGDMVDTGPDEIKLHEMVLSQCCDSHIDLIGLIGKRFFAAAENMNLLRDKRFVLSHDLESLVEEILKRVDRDDIVLVKGGRLTELDKFVDALMKGLEFQW